MTSYETGRDQTSGNRTGLAPLGFLAHEMRNLLMTSMLTFDALSKGNVGVHGSTGKLLGRSLRRMRALIDRTLAEVRLEAGTPTVERVQVAALLEEIEIVATIEAKDQNLQLSVEPGPYDVAVQGDHQILASVLANLVQNAIKFTVPGGHVKLRAQLREGRVLIDVADQCGGLPPGSAENLFRPFEQHGLDRSGMGLGLAISLKGVRASGGQLHVLDRPGLGCVFTVDLPLAKVQ